MNTRRLAIIAAATLFVVGCFGLANTQASVATFGFESVWTGDYAPGWENTAYRWGEAPVGKMMQQTSIAHSGSYGMKLTASSVPQAWMWWAAVNVQSVSSDAMQKQYNPYVSVWYYDQGHNFSAARNAAGQLFAVPDWVVADDWTDVQLGGRPWGTPPDHYYASAQDLTTRPWQDTLKSRPTYDPEKGLGTWVELKFQLSNSDGKIHFFIGGDEVGTSVRSDYTSMGTEVGLYTMFDAALADWGDNLPYTIWDDFSVGSSYTGGIITPEPATMVIWGLLGVIGYGIYRRRRTA
jgi:hypothetical protein